MKFAAFENALRKKLTLTNAVDFHFKPFDGKLPPQDILKQSDGTIKISSKHNGLLYAAKEDGTSENLPYLSQLSYSVPKYMRQFRRTHVNEYLDNMFHPIPPPPPSEIMWLINICL